MMCDIRQKEILLGDIAITHSGGGTRWGLGGNVAVLLVVWAGGTIGSEDSE